MVPKELIVVFLLVALVFSVAATYATVTSFGEVGVEGPVNRANVGLFVEPARDANVGINVLPVEKEDEK